MNPDGGPVSAELQVDDASQVGTARRATASLAHGLGFGEDARGRLALAVTELATNLARHAREGRLLVRATPRAATTGAGGEATGTIEVIAVDRGPGIADLGAALSDGFSTGGTRGAGLGAVKRAVEDFDITSQAGLGTAVVVRVRERGRNADDAPLGVVCRPHPGEQLCGDAWLLREGPGRTTLVVVDGLGHGPAAALAAAEAMHATRALLDDRSDAAAGLILETIHAALKNTRGAAGAAAVVDRDTSIVHYAGIGNIAGAVVTPGDQRNLVSHAGILGHQVQKVQEFTQPWPSGGMLVMHSDGLSTRWRLDQYPGITTRDPALLAAVLHRDFSRGRDDATIVATRAVPMRRS